MGIFKTKYLFFNLFMAIIFSGVVYLVYKNIGRDAAEMVFGTMVLFLLCAILEELKDVRKGGAQ